MRKVPPGGPVAMFGLIKELGLSSLMKVREKRAEAGHFIDFDKFLPQGSDAPDFSLQNLKGVDISLKDFRGNYLVLEFGAYT